MNRPFTHQDAKYVLWSWPATMASRTAGTLSGQEVCSCYGAGHPMMGTVLMLFFGLPSITRSLYAT